MKPIYLCLLLLLFFCVSCNSATNPEEAALNVPTAIVTGIPLNAEGCVLSIQAAQITRRFPPNCVLNTRNCLGLEGDDRLLSVWFAGDAGCDLTALADKLVQEEEIYLQAPDGTRSLRYVTGVYGQRLALGFMLNSPADNVLLIWKDNAPIKLPPAVVIE